MSSLNEALPNIFLLCDQDFSSNCHRLSAPEGFATAMWDLEPPAEAGFSKGNPPKWPRKVKISSGLLVITITSMTLGSILDRSTKLLPNSKNFSNQQFLVIAPAVLWMCPRIFLSIDGLASSSAFFLGQVPAYVSRWANHERLRGR